MEKYLHHHLFIILLVLFPFTISAQGYLRADGKKIVNDNGPVLLRGLNMGNWFVNEGYMMEMTPKADAPHEINTVFEELIGKENTIKFFDVWRTHYIQQKDVDTIAKLGFNHVRLPFHYNLISPKDSPGVYIEKGFAFLDHAIEMFKKRKIYVILDMHCVPGSANAAGHGDSYGGADLWKYKKNQDRLCEIWKVIAKRYENEPWVGGYDLVNESVNTEDMPENKLMREVFIRATEAIREVDNKHIIFVEGNWYASDFRGLTPTWDKNMAYSFHKYWTPNTTEHMQYLFDIMNNFNVPLWEGEAGENSNNWYGDHIKMLEENNIGWCWWLYKKPNSITAPFALKFTPGWNRLKEYFKGASSKPSLEYATNALLHFAANTTLENCEFKPDVYQAIMRNDYITQTTPWPFDKNKIPGRLNAIHYDIGKNGNAYKDNVYETNSNSPFLTWNNNWIGRNDGVDMELQSDTVGESFILGTDTVGTDYTITGIENGEWIVFTVDIESAGSYDVDFRIAAAGNGGTIKLKLDDQTIGKEISVPSTFGKYKWKTITANNFILEKGKHKLKVLFLNGGFNFNYLAFKKSGL